GATGYAGRHIVRQLHDGGYRVRAVVRDQQRALETGDYDAPALHGRVDEWIVSSDGSQLDASIMTEVDHVVSALGVTRQQADPWTVDFLLNLHYLKLAEQQDVKTFMYIGVMNAATGDFDGVASKTCLHGSVGPIIGTRSNSEPLRLLLRPHRSVQRGPSRHGIRSRQWEHAALPDPR